MPRYAVEVEYYATPTDGSILHGYLGVESPSSKEAKRFAESVVRNGGFELVNDQGDKHQSANGDTYKVRHVWEVKMPNFKVEVIYDVPSTGYMQIEAATADEAESEAQKIIDKGEFMLYEDDLCNTVPPDYRAENFEAVHAEEIVDEEEDEEETEEAAL